MLLLVIVSKKKLKSMPYNYVYAQREEKRQISM